MLTQFNKVILGILVGYFSIILLGCSDIEPPRATKDFNFNWKFSLLDSLETAHTNTFDNSKWRNVKLPHDWSIELPFDSIKGEGNTAYLLGGIGWYRKQFDVDFSENQLVYILFDGVYNKSEIWINNKKIGNQIYGYSPFYFNITSYLNKSGKSNTITLKVDNSQYLGSRWYTGSGIYRNVKLITTDKLHIPVWGTFVTTPKVSNEEAEINIQLEIDNRYDTIKIANLKTEVFDKNGKIVLELSQENINIKSGKQVFTQKGVIAQPLLWSINTPNLYKTVTTTYVNNEMVDKYTSTFGIRSIRFDSDLGFFLNDKNIKIKGVCIHHDAGLIGAAVPKGVWKRRLLKLKEAGVNAIRSAHNPASQEFLDLCDELGFLVQDEFYDEWDYPKDKRLNVWERHDDYISRGLAEYFRDIAEKDLKATVLAHRNHPSIFQWSIGNEIEWTYPNVKEATGYYKGNKRIALRRWAEPPKTPAQIRTTYNNLTPHEYTIGATAKKLAQWTKELDTTRFVTANCIIPTGSFETGYTDALDVVGFSYRQIIYDYAHKNYPDKSIMGTENWGQWHEWKAAIDRPFVAGVFLWTGIDYLGEANQKWPKKGSRSGLLNLAGFERSRFHMFKTLWDKSPHIYISSQKLSNTAYKINTANNVVYKIKDSWKHKTWSWQNVNEHWNYKKGENIVVEVISNLDSVALFLNDRSLGTKYLKDFPDRIYKWHVQFEKGRLLASNPQKNTEISTALTPVRVELKVDKDVLISDGYDVAHVEVQLFDKNNVPVKHVEKQLEFIINGPITNLGVDNGSVYNSGPYKSNKVKTHQGKALLVLQTKKNLQGEVQVQLKSDLDFNPIILNVE